MALKVEKREREATQSLVRRFSRAIKDSGVLREARKRRFFKRPLSEKAKRGAALRKIKAREEYQKNEKLGLNKPKFSRFR